MLSRFICRLKRSSPNEAQPLNADQTSTRRWSQRHCSAYDCRSLASGYKRSVSDVMSSYPPPPPPQISRRKQEEREETVLSLIGLDFFSKEHNYQRIEPPRCRPPHPLQGSAENDGDTHTHTHTSPGQQANVSAKPRGATSAIGSAMGCNERFFY